MNFLEFPKPVKCAELGDREDSCCYEEGHDGSIPVTRQWDVVCLIDAKLDLVFMAKLPEEAEPRVLGQFAIFIVVQLEYVAAQSNLHHEGLVSLQEKCRRGSVHSPVLTKIVDTCTQTINVQG